VRAQIARMKQLDLSGFAQYPAPLPQADLPSDPDTTIRDGTLAQSLNNDFIAGQQRLLYTEPDAFYRKQGADALATVPAVLGKLQDLRDRLLDTTTNAHQRQNLARSLDNHLIVSRDNIARHAAQQSLVWQKATAQNRLDLLQKQAGFDYTDPESIANYADAARSAALDQARIAGLPADSGEAATMASNAASGIWRSAIEAALAKDDTRPAIALHEVASGSLAPADAALLDRYIDGARERKTGRDYVAGISMPADDPSAPLNVAKSLADLDAAHAAATTQNQADWPDNASQRATNQHFIDVQFGRKKRDVIQAKADIDRALANWLNEPASDGQPQTELPPPSIWNRLGDEAQRALLAQLARNASGTSDVQLVSDKSESGPPTATGASATAATTTTLPMPEAPILPSLGEGAAAALGAAEALASIAGPATLAAGLLIPSNSQPDSLSLGDGLRASSFGDVDSATIERRVGDGLFGTGIGARWEDLHVRARFGRPTNGHRTLFVDPDGLERAIGKEAAQRVLTTPGVAAAPQTPPQASPPPVPWVVEIHIAASTDQAKTIDHPSLDQKSKMSLLNKPEMWRDFSANPPLGPQAIDEFEVESNIRLPDDYASFLQKMNGGEGMIGDAFLALWRIEDLLTRNRANEVDEYAPGFFIFGSDGGGEAFGFDLRSDAKEVVCLPFIGMDWESAIRIAPTFTDFLEVITKSSLDIFSRSRT
jgi:SMI1 / KNR4 family (SUKH-1)